MKTHLKSAISALLCYVLILSLFPLWSVQVAAASGYSGAGTESNPYVVTTGDGLEYVLTNYNAEGVFIALGSDISLPASHSDNIQFLGTLDGRFHRITTTQRLFYSNYGSIKNLYYGSKVVTYGSTTSYLCHQNRGTISFVIVEGYIDIDDDGYWGALFTISNYGSILNCGAIGSIYIEDSDDTDAGGIAVYNYNSAVINNCYVDARVDARAWGRYSDEYDDPITTSNSGSVSNCYYNKDRYGAQTSRGTGLSAGEMRSESLVNKLNAQLPDQGILFDRDIQGVNDWLPLFRNGLNYRVNSSKASGLLNGAELITLSHYDATAQIYYTVDGSVPTTSSMRYTSALRIADDCILTAVAYKNGLYSVVSRYEYANIPGAGTESNPYKISSEADWNMLGKLDLSKSFILTKDIVMTDMFKTKANFTGRFDGQGHTISNLYSSPHSVQYGLFENNYGIIQNVSLVGAADHPWYSYGAITNFNNGVVYNCHFSGSMNSGNMADTTGAGLQMRGGIANVNQCRIENCSFNGELKVNIAICVGGIVGYNGGDILYSNFSGSVSVNNVSTSSSSSLTTNPSSQGFAAGIAGYSTENSSICFSSATGSVSAIAKNCGIYLAGITAQNRGTVTDCNADVEMAYQYYSSYSNRVGQFELVNGNEPVNTGEPVPAAHPHQFETETAAATCTLGSGKRFYCACGAESTYRAAGSELGHAYVSHPAQTPTCISGGWNAYQTCSRCDYSTFEELPANPNNHINTVALDQIDPSCFEVGYTAGIYCNDCEMLVSGREEIPMTDHAWSQVEEITKANCVSTGLIKLVCSTPGCGAEKEEATPIDATYHVNTMRTRATNSTCYSHGYTAGLYCTDCEKYVSGHEEKPLLDHVWNDGEITKTPTCSETGIRTYTCTAANCGATNEEVLPVDETNHVNTSVVLETYSTCIQHGFTAGVFCADCETYLSGHEEKQLAAHTWDMGEVTLAPTCLDTGILTFTCTVNGCGETREESLRVDPDNHAAELTITKNVAPTCLTAGEIVGNCPACHKDVYEYPAALGHDYIIHAAKAPTCTDAGWETYQTCSRCDYSTFVELNALGHDLVSHDAKEPTCTENGWDAYETCSRCDYSTFAELEALGHDLTFHKAKEPTCTEVGWKAYTDCAYCDYTTYVEKAALGHDYVNHDAKAPTCTEIGWDAYQTCSRCDDSTYIEKAALGHDLILHEAKPVTCTEGGWDAYETCSRCDYSTFAAKDALGHDLVIHGAKAPTCTEVGWETYTDCTYCDYSTYVELAPIGHDYIDHEAKEPTCTEVGWDAYQTCSRCDYTTYNEIAAIGHNLVRHDGKVPTCTELGWDAYKTCTRCDYTTYAEKPALGHVIVKHAAKAPTCTEIGWDDYDTCSRCDYSTYSEKAALGHDYIVYAAKAETCTEIGWDVYQTCRRCDYSSYAEKAALGHDLIQHDAKVVTCTENGWGAYETCSRCDYTTFEEKAALGHSFTKYVSDGDASCTADGTKTAKCDRCDETDTVADEDSALGHSFTNYVSNGDAACTADGTKTAKCDRCDEMETITDVGSAHGHDVEHHEGKAATCTEAGWEAYETCKRCDYTTYTEIDALGHTPGEAVIENETAAICTEPGSYDEVVYCSVCSDELSRETKTTEALGHTPGEAVIENETAAICTEPGSYDEVVYCSVCGDELSRETKTTEALGHTLGEAVRENEVAASCRAEGRYDEVIYCSVCEAELSRETKTIDKLDHIPSEAVCENIVEATYTTGGSYDNVIYCATCNEELSRETVATDPLGHTHDYVSETTKEATCTEDGEEIYTCSLCGDTYTEPISATGEHVDEDNDGRCDTCGQQMTGGDHCKYCGQIHGGAFGWLTKFFHSILALFGARK